MRRWLNEPLIHFLLLGGVIYLAYFLTSQEEPATDEILISQQLQQNLVNHFTRSWQRAPTSTEFATLLDDYVREEVAYRQSMKMGIDQGDSIVRQRLRQLLESFSEEAVRLNDPTDEQLVALMRDHEADFRLDTRWSLNHIYFNPGLRGDALSSDAEGLLRNISDSGLQQGWKNLGDPLSATIPSELSNYRESDIARLFGRMFSNELEGLQIGRWTGPLESGLGLHLVFIGKRIEGSLPELENVRDAVQREWFKQQRTEALDRLYERLQKDYPVEVESFNFDKALTQP